MTPTQSPTMASQATAELPKLPEPDIIEADFGDGGWADCSRKQFYSAQHDGYATRTGFTADQMNAHYLAGVEAGRASRAQSEGTEIVTQADVNRARELILDATSTDLLSGDRKVRKADRAIVYGWLCEAANVLVGEVPATHGETK